MRISKLAVSLFISLIFSFLAHGKVNHEYEQIVQKFFPQSLSSLKNPLNKSSSKPLTFENGRLDYSYSAADLNGNSKDKYLVVLYRAKYMSAHRSCELRVIDVKENKFTENTIYAFESSIEDCSKEFSLIDLDGDKRPEIVVKTEDKVGNEEAPNLFKWDGRKLVEITPTVIFESDRINALRSVKITAAKINSSSLIIDSPEVHYLHGEESGTSDDKTYKTYLLIDGMLKQTSSYDFYDYTLKDANEKPEWESLETRFLTAGDYILEVKNLSEHKKPIRAEVVVNGNVVLKPQDFCQSLPVGKPKPEFVGADDLNEDKMKGCPPKADAFAMVNLKEKNDIKIRIFGPGGSAASISLKKK